MLRPVDRSNILDDAFNLASATLLDYNTALSLTKYMEAEDHYFPWHTAKVNFGYIGAMLYGHPEFHLWRVGINLHSSFFHTRVRLSLSLSLTLSLFLCLRACVCVIASFRKPLRNVNCQSVCRGNCCLLHLDSYERTSARQLCCGHVQFSPENLT